MRKVFVNNYKEWGIDKKLILSIVSEILSKENAPTSLEIGVTFVDDEYIRDLNKKYRSCDSATDVLSFLLEDNELLFGDIYISAEKAKEQAKEYNNPLEKEISLLVIHGILHILGFNDETVKDREKMRERENRYLNENPNDK
jgi:probable rRNA maturation factor